MAFSDNDRARVAAAIGAAEKRTAGEVVVIVAREVWRYPATCLSVAALAALALPVAALLLDVSPGSWFAGWDAAASAASERRGLEALVAAQALAFGSVLALAWFAGLGRILTPSGLRRDRVHRAALVQFRARGLEATTGRTGVLIYIDMAERIAEVVADTAIYAKVTPDHWATTITALTDGIKAGRAADGIVAAIGLAGDVLAEHFPVSPDDVNELPDRMIEL